MITIEEWRAQNISPNETLSVAPLQHVVVADARVLFEFNDPEYRGGNPCAQFPGLQLLADKTGINERTLRRIAKGTNKKIPVDLADQYMCATGRHLRDLWPAYYGETT